MAVNLCCNVRIVGVPHHVPDLVLFRRRGTARVRARAALSAAPINRFIRFPPFLWVGCFFLYTI